MAKCNQLTFLPFKGLIKLLYHLPVTESQWNLQ